MFCPPDEDAKHMSEIESANRGLMRELEQTKVSLRETEKSLRATEQEKGNYRQQLHSTLSSLGTVMKELKSVLPNVCTTSYVLFIIFLSLWLF